MKNPLERPNRKPILIWVSPDNAIIIHLSSTIVCYKVYLNKCISQGYLFAENQAPFSLFLVQSTANCLDVKPLFANSNIWSVNVQHNKCHIIVTHIRDWNNYLAQVHLKYNVKCSIE